MLYELPTDDTIKFRKFMDENVINKITLNRKNNYDISDYQIDNLKDLGKTFLKIRAEKNIGTLEMARMCGITRNTLRCIEREKNVYSPTLVRAVENLEDELEDLIAE